MRMFLAILVCKLGRFVGKLVTKAEEDAEKRLATYKRMADK